MQNKKEIKKGIILSYMLIFINMIYGILIIPFILKHVGSLDYGVFKSVSSLSSSLAVLDLGLGSTMTRYMSKYNAEKTYKEANNFAAMMFIQYAMMTIAIVTVGMVFFASLDSIYEKTFTNESLLLARRLLFFLILNMVLRLFENLLTGITNGFEHFSFSNGIRLVSVLAKIILIILFLPIAKNVIIIVGLECIITFAAIIVLTVYIVKQIGVVPRLDKWDTRVFRESFGYTGLMFLQSLTIQFNGNIDNVLIGAKLGAASVTVYSIGLQLFGIYESLSGSIANIMLPTMTKKIAKGATAEQLQNGVEKCGRMQLLVLSAALGGFIILGKDFFRLWLGEGYDDSYYVALLLMIPVTFTMVQNVSLSILRAQNKMIYRTITLMISCLINFTVSFAGIKYYGYWGTAFGTAIATICNLLFMNFYYHVHLGFKIKNMFINIMSTILPCALISSIVTWFFHSLYNGTWTSFVVSIIVFMIVYITLLILWGLKEEEKEFLFGRILKNQRRRSAM